MEDILTQQDFDSVFNRRPEPTTPVPVVSQYELNRLNYIRTREEREAERDSKLEEKIREHDELETARAKSMRNRVCHGFYEASLRSPGVDVPIEHYGYTFRGSFRRYHEE